MFKIKIYKITLLVLIYIVDFKVNAQGNCETINPQHTFVFSKENQKQELFDRYFKKYDSLVNNKEYDKAKTKIDDLIAFSKKKNLNKLLTKALFRKGVLLSKIYNVNKEININERIKCYVSILEISEREKDLYSEF